MTVGVLPGIGEHGPGVGGRQSGGRRSPIVAPLERTVNLAHTLAVDDAGNIETGTAIAIVRTSSEKLRCHISIGFSAAVGMVNQQPPGEFWGAAVTLRALRPGDADVNEGELHTIVSGLALPVGYELDSEVRGVKVTAALSYVSIDPAFGTGFDFEGDWVLGVTWEPAEPMCDDEAALLYAGCGVYLLQYAGTLGATE